MILKFLPHVQLLANLITSIPTGIKNPTEPQRSSAWILICDDSFGFSCMQVNLHLLVTNWSVALQNLKITCKDLAKWKMSYVPLWTRQTSQPTIMQIKIYTLSLCFKENCEMVKILRMIDGKPFSMQVSTKEKWN